jgi:flagellar motor switch protein FliM
MDRQEHKMALDRVLSPDEIDVALRNSRDSESEEDLAKHTEPYDFRRPDRIAKDQLRAIHLLHENFARSLASSLSAYLRAYVMVNLVSVEQISFKEFTQCLPSPTCMASLGLRPYEGSAVLELNPSLVFPIIEMLLGGNGKISAKLTREITEIEQSILDGLLRIILQNMKLAWHSVTNLEFTIESHETEPALLQILAPNEALVAISMEVRIGENSGMMNIGIPSIIIKMLRQKFDQQWSVRKTDVTEDEHSRILRLIKSASIHVDARLQGPTIAIEDMMRLESGDVLTFDYASEKPVDLLINGKLKFRGQIVSTGKKKAFAVQETFKVFD